MLNSRLRRFCLVLSLVSLFPCIPALVQSAFSLPTEVDGQTMEELTADIERNPRDPMAYLRRAKLHQLRDERHSAIDDYSKLIEIDPANGQAYMARSEMYLMTCDYGSALADTAKVVSLFPKWSESYDQKARIERVTGRFHEAIDDCLKSLKLDPRDARAMSNLVESYDELGQHQKALDAAFYQIDVEEEDSMKGLMFAYDDRGMSYIHCSQYDDAVKDFENASKVSPKNSQPYAYLALAYAYQDRMEEAKAAIAKTVALETFAPRGFRLRGEVYRAAGKWEDAIRDYNLSTSMEPDYGPGHMQKAIAEIALGQYQEAERDLNKSVEREPTAIAYSYLALAKELVGQPREADQCMEKAFSITPDLSILFANQAKIYVHRCQLVKAIESASEALRLDPYVGDAYAAASFAFSRNSDEKRASELMLIAKANGWREQVSMWQDKEPKCPASSPLSITTPQLVKFKPQPFTAVDLNSAPE